jgi:hypothetical protein
MQTLEIMKLTVLMFNITSAGSERTVLQQPCTALRLHRLRQSDWRVSAV